MTSVTDGASPEKAQHRLTVSTLLRLLFTFFGAFRRNVVSAASSTNRRSGELLQLAGLASTLTGVFILFGLGVGLVITGLTAVVLGTLHEAGRL